jgi:GTP-binding protein LepA
MRIAFGATSGEYAVDEVGYMRLGRFKVDELGPGEVGYVLAGIKRVSDTKVGDTILDADDRATELLPGYREIKPMVFSGLYPSASDDYEALRDALEKLKLNDASLFYEPETSTALGFGFRCGFLGLLHMEIVQERLEREFDLDLIASAPSVEYRVKVNHRDDELVVDNPAQMPPAGEIEQISEPWVSVQVITPTDYIGPVMELATGRRAEFQTMEYLDPKRVNLHFEMPLGELIIDFYDQLKSRSSGYASLDYHYLGYRPGDLVKLDVLVNAEPVDALSLIVHRSNAYRQGKTLVEKLKELIPRQMFEVPVQAAIGSHIISRETIRAMRKNVLAKCYGGDVTRKRKLLEKQKEGKQRMKRIGSVEIPQEAFLAVLRMNEAS